MPTRIGWTWGREEKRMCTVEKRGRVYLLTLVGLDEHRLNPPLLASIRSALARIRSDAAAAGMGGASLVTAAEGKFFCNGFDLAWARSSPSDAPLMSDALRRIVADLLSLPMPTVAAVTGHATAGGCALVLGHDHVVMRADRGFFYMSELHIGIRLPEYFMALLRAKIADPRARRDVLLRDERMTAAQAAMRGIVDQAVDGAAGTVEAAVAMAEELVARNWDGEVYASIRRGAFREASKAAGLVDEVVEEDEQATRRKRAASKL